MNEERDRAELFTVNQLAQALGVTARAIRFYEAKGLIAPRRVGTTRVFDRRDRARLMLVLRGKRLGFTLAEIREFLDLYDADRTQAAQVRLLLTRTRQRVAELEQQRRDLEQTLHELRQVEREALERLHERGVVLEPEAEGTTGGIPGAAPEPDEPEPDEPESARPEPAEGR